MSTTRSTGNRGEAEVARYLRKKGYTLLASQWRCRFGELDLVARDRRGTVCFVEVKLRSAGAIGLPREFVDARKQECCRCLSQYTRHRRPRPVRRGGGLRGKRWRPPGGIPGERL